MNLTPMQKFSQNAILTAIYPGLSIEEAREKEKNHDHCLLLSKKFTSIDGTIYELDEPQIFSKINHFYRHSNNIISQVIGLPPTLPRVLEALGKNIGYNYGRLENMYDGSFDCKRKLLNEDKTDANLRNQPPETQLAIAKLIGREE